MHNLAYFRGYMHKSAAGIKGMDDASLTKGVTSTNLSGGAAQAAAEGRPTIGNVIAQKKITETVPTADAKTVVGTSKTQAAKQDISMGAMGKAKPVAARRQVDAAINTVKTPQRRNADAATAAIGRTN